MRYLITYSIDSLYDTTKGYNTLAAAIEDLLVAGYLEMSNNTYLLPGTLLTATITDTKREKIQRVLRDSDPNRSSIRELGTSIDNIHRTATNKGSKVSHTSYLKTWIIGK